MSHEKISNRIYLAELRLQLQFPQGMDICYRVPCNFNQKFHKLGFTNTTVL